ncbi:MAG: alcohol dehydrogenase zinc-binding protein [Crocinitomicaceae bacterium]|nr:alcohol dehydrogenase zinc-binding protein [Crocinitomicaceae bacterium]
MKAVTRNSYCTPEGLSICEIEIPVPKEHEILIRVHATTVNRTDCAILTGKPYIMRLFTGLFKPKSPVPGTDFAGVVDAVGKEVSVVKPGDQVWGFDDIGIGSQAHYFILPDKKPISIIPKGFSYEEAAASIEGTHYAYNFINKVKLKAGQRALVNGASGAIGSALVQFLKSRNVYVAATCNTKNLDLIRGLGADKVIDYTAEDFTRSGEKYDYVFDAVGKSTFSKCKALLSPKGIYISSELGPGGQNMFLPFLTPFLGGRKVIFPFPSNIPRSMEFIKKLVEEGKFKPLTDRTYPMEQAAEAYTFVQSGQKTGNVVLVMNVE